MCFTRFRCFGMLLTAEPPPKRKSAIAVLFTGSRCLAAKTTIHVASEDHASRLAALINELTSSSQKQDQAA